MKGLITFWYQKAHPLSTILYPLHWVMFLLVKARKLLYTTGIFKSSRISAPVIIVGNITVGGSGKSPLVIYLAEQFTELGYKVGVLSRGYGGHSNNYPLEVSLESLTSIVGDEPLMIKQRTNVKVVVDPIRVRGAEFLVEQCECDLILCDDGLQHYALQRDIELLVIDGQRQFGNGLLMPFGPLREPVSRSKEVDVVVVNGPTNEVLVQTKEQFSMELVASQFVPLDKNQTTLEIEQLLEQCQNKKVNAVAGIGNPPRFFNYLNELGFNTINHQFEDHHKYSSDDFNSMDGVIIMTEKDAVKCQNIVKDNSWYLKVNAEFTPSVTQSITQFCQSILKQN